MRIRLVALLLGALLAGNHAAALAGPEKNRGHDRSHAEHSQQRQYDDKHWRKDRVDSRSRHQARHAQRSDKGSRHGRRHATGGRHGQHWSKHRHYRHFNRHRAPYARHHGHARGHGKGRYHHAPHNGLSIILHGHF